MSLGTSNPRFEVPTVKNLTVSMYLMVVMLPAPVDYVDHKLSSPLAELDISDDIEVVPCSQGKGKAVARNVTPPRPMGNTPPPNNRSKQMISNPMLLSWLTKFVDREEISSLSFPWISIINVYEEDERL